MGQNSHLNFKEGSECVRKSSFLLVLFSSVLVLPTSLVAWLKKTCRVRKGLPRLAPARSHIEMTPRSQLARTTLSKRSQDSAVRTATQSQERGPRLLAQTCPRSNSDAVSCPQHRRPRKHVRPQRTPERLVIRASSQIQTSPRRHQISTDINDRSTRQTRAIQAPRRAGGRTPHTTLIVRVTYLG